MERLVHIEIAGQQFAIRSDEGAEYVHELAAYVDAHLQKISAGHSTASLQRIVMLVAIQLADELFREKDLHRRFRTQVSERLEQLQRMVKEHEKTVEKLTEQALQLPPAKTAP